MHCICMITHVVFSVLIRIYANGKSRNITLQAITKHLDLYFKFYNEI
jgi:hypothetical protein